MRKIGIIGVGNMGTHLIKLIFRNKLGPYVLASDQNLHMAKENLSRLDKNILRPINTVVEECDILFLTVKPNNVKEVCYLIKKNDRNKVKIVVSAAAGVSINHLNTWLDDRHYTVRMMPNIPISINQGSIVWYSDCCPSHVLNRIWEGPEILRVTDEKLMDVATILFGCTPAYVAKVFQIYEDMAEEMGFSPLLAKKLLSSTFRGSSDLLSNIETSKIIQQVASRGGATEKGLEMLTKGGFDDILKQSLKESYERIQDIRKNLD